MERIEASLKEVEDLSNIVDPETEPYKSKYQARQILIGIKEELQGDSEEIELCLARVEYLLGVNFAVTEEKHDAILQLVSSLKRFGLDPEWTPPINKQDEFAEIDQIVSEIEKESFTFSSLCDTFSCEVIDALNHIGVLWSQNEDYTFQAIRSLTLSRRLYEQAKSIYSSFNHPIETNSNLIDQNQHTQGSVQDTDSGKSKKMEDLHTHTLFYLAQAYRHVGHYDKSCALCHITLQRQLDSEDFDPIDWISNTLGIVNYYLGEDYYDLSFQCLTACSQVIEHRMTEDQDKSSTQANVSRAWALYYAHILKQSQRIFLKKQELSETEQLQRNDIIFFFKKIHDLVQDFDIPLFCVTNEPVPEHAPVLPHQITNFEQARELFKQAQHWFGLSLQYFVLDGYVSDHINLIQEQSQLYKSLIIFENDDNRQIAMFKRRIKLLEYPLSELNRNVYTYLLKQMSFELGEIYSDLLDVQLHKLEAKEMSAWKPSDLIKIKQTIDKGTEAYNLFIDLFKTQEGNDPSSIEEENLYIYLMAHYRKARLCSKMEGPRDVKVEYLVQSLHLYQLTVEKAQQIIPQGSKVFEKEVEMCYEMISLLPSRIDNVHYNK